MNEKTTNKFKYSIKELNKYLDRNSIKFHEEKSIQWESDFGIEYLNDEVNSTIKKLLKEKGLFWDKNFIYVDMNIWQPQIIPTIVRESYDGLLKDMGVWEKLDLQGDGDIDYNGTYIECIIDAIEFARSHNWYGETSK